MSMNEKAKANLEKEYSLEIPLNNFSAYQCNESTKSTQNNFIGRTKQLFRFTEILKSTEKGGGSFLVSGYRGSGKTQFVRKAIDNYKRNEKYLRISFLKKPVLDVKINLGIDNKLDTKTILHDMVYLLRERLYDSLPLLYKIFYKYFTGFNFLWFVIIPAFIVVSYFSFTNELTSYLDTVNNMFRQAVTQDVTIGVAVGAVSIAMLIFMILFAMTSRRIRMLKKVDELITDINCETATIKTYTYKISRFQRKIVTAPLDPNAIETRLRSILMARRYPDVIFIFDELDKLTGATIGDPTAELSITKDIRNRKKQVDRLLGELKNLVTNSQARFIFIAGRDMYDAYLSERGSPNSLYESLFSHCFYISSLLTDHSDHNVYLLDSMIETFVVSRLMPRKEVERIMKKNLNPKSGEDDGKTEKQKEEAFLAACKLSTYNSWLKENPEKHSEATNEAEKADIEKEARFQHIYLLKTFIHFLALHSWGNYKRLITLFDSFVHIKEDSKTAYINLTTRAIQRLVLASHLYILFHHNLSRTLMNADDKLVVSAFSSFHYIMKFHGMGFSRGHINRMYEAINLHSSPELMYVIDIIINSVLNNHIRRIRNSMYRYRFTSLYEQEIHYITSISDHDSAAFDFSLDAMESVKQHYKDLMDIAGESTSITKMLEKASVHVILGNYSFWEQSYDEAAIHYEAAAKIYLNSYRQNEDDLSLLVQLVEVYLKQANLAERSHNYSMAAAIYIKAERLAADKIKEIDNVDYYDSKWDVLKQPRWGLKFLNLKRSAIHYRNYDVHKLKDGKIDDVCQYREGLLAYYMDDYHDAFKSMISVAESTNPLVNTDERSAYLGANACLKAGLSLISAFGKQLNSKLTDIMAENKAGEGKGGLDGSREKLEVSLDAFLKEVLGVLQRLKDVTTLEDYINKVVNVDKKNFIGLHSKEPFSAEIDRLIKHDPNKNNKGDNKYFVGLGLIALSAKVFEGSRIYANAALSYLCIYMMWELLLEIIPWRILDVWEEYSSRVSDNYHNYKTEKMTIEGTIDNLKKEYPKDIFISNLEKRDVLFDSIIQIGKSVKEIRSKSWIDEAQESAFRCNAHLSKKSMSHFMKTALRRNLQEDMGKTLFQYRSPRDMILHEDYLKYLLYQHYSMFGQLTVAAYHWEYMASSQFVTWAKEVNIEKGNILPYSIRYYSIMSWLKGKKYLKNLKDQARENKIQEAKDQEYLKAAEDPIEAEKTFQQKKEQAYSNLTSIANNAIVNLFRASQYISKTSGPAANTMLPPSFLIYYNMWEVLFLMVEKYLEIHTGKYSYKEAVLNVQQELDAQLSEAMDVSSIVLDLEYLKQSTLDLLLTVERMGDPNSRERTNILRNKYYLDDDYEDILFNMDWCYSRSFAGGALVHRLTIEYETARLKKKSQKPAVYQFIAPSANPEERAAYEPKQPNIVKDNDE